jgi:hypothetical protein
MCGEETSPGGRFRWSIITSVEYSPGMSAKGFRDTRIDPTVETGEKEEEEETGAEECWG